jgi:hypothetical protein
LEHPVEFPIGVDHNERDLASFSLQSVEARLWWRSGPQLLFAAKPTRLSTEFPFDRWHRGSIVNSERICLLLPQRFHSPSPHLHSFIN